MKIGRIYYYLKFYNHINTLGRNKEGTMSLPSEEYDSNIPRVQFLQH